MKRDNYDRSSKMTMMSTDQMISNVVNLAMEDMVCRTPSTIPNLDWTIAVKLILGKSFSCEGQIAMEVVNDDDMQIENGMEQSLEQSLEQAYELHRV
mmetsp:Transcript_84/g.116  ORF Transcript_84/g.116 Transcript_84/m.116 type:complete len:97 (+) Transcript_84:128-418(+)